MEFSFFILMPSKGHWQIAHLFLHLSVVSTRKASRIFGSVYCCHRWNSAKKGRQKGDEHRTQLTKSVLCDDATTYCCFMSWLQNLSTVIQLNLGAVYLQQWMVVRTFYKSWLHYCEHEISILTLFATTTQYIGWVCSAQPSSCVACSTQITVG